MVQVISSVSQKSHYPPHFLTHSSRSRANFFRTYILWDRLDDPPARLDNFATPSVCYSIKTIVTLHLECCFFLALESVPNVKKSSSASPGNLLPTRDQIYPHRYSEAFSLTHLSLWIPRRFACRSRLCYPYTSPWLPMQIRNATVPFVLPFSLLLRTFHLLMFHSFHSPVRNISVPSSLLPHRPFQTSTFVVLPPPSRHSIHSFDILLFLRDSGSGSTPKLSNPSFSTLRIPNLLPSTNYKN